MPDARWAKLGRVLAATGAGVSLLLAAYAAMYPCLCRRSQEYEGVIIRRVSRDWQMHAFRPIAWFEARCHRRDPEVRFVVLLGDSGASMGFSTTGESTGFLPMP